MWLSKQCKEIHSTENRICYVFILARIKIQIDLRYMYMYQHVWYPIGLRFGECTFAFCIRYRNIAFNFVFKVYNKMYVCLYARIFVYMSCCAGNFFVLVWFGFSPFLFTLFCLSCCCVFSSFFLNTLDGDDGVRLCMCVTFLLYYLILNYLSVTSIDSLTGICNRNHMVWQASCLCLSESTGISTHITLTQILHLSIL